MPFDAKRMIFGGFESLVKHRPPQASRSAECRTAELSA